jgi:hypothetical protein
MGQIQDSLPYSGTAFAGDCPWFYKHLGRGKVAARQKKIAGQGFGGKTEGFKKAKRLHRNRCNQLKMK